MGVFLQAVLAICAVVVAGSLVMTVVELGRIRCVLSACQESRRSFSCYTTSKGTGLSDSRMGYSIYVYRQGLEYQN